jgi:signal transduction histidine kinase
VPVASSPIAAQAYSRRRFRLSPSLANRLTIGFAIAFAVLTGLAVIGVARFIQQRQDYEDATARSYQRELTARTRLAQGDHAAAARATIIAQQRRRAALRDGIAGQTRDTALLVGAGLIAGLTGAALLFSGLISSMRRPLEDLVAASERLAGGDLDARVQVGGLAETATLGRAFNEMADELQRRAGERDQLDRMKDEFVLTASHELRSPLTSVQGFAELLMLERDKLNPKQRETVEIILDNSRHLVRLLNELLDLARSDAGQLRIEPRPIEVRTLVDDAERAMRSQLDGKDQMLEDEIEPDLPRVNADRDRVRQVMVNLLTNANEYCPAGSSIRVTAQRVGEEVEIAVIDDGPGIPAAQLEHIFERFTRGDAGMTQRVGGTGLGLAISKSLVELHGGAIAAESTPGRGSTFSFRLPTETVAEPASTDPAEAEAL